MPKSKPWKQIFMVIFATFAFYGGLLFVIETWTAMFFTLSFMAALIAILAGLSNIEWEVKNRNV